MSTITQEALTGIRLLVCMAKADGVMSPDERFALHDSLAGIEGSLPDGLSAERLLDENNDPAALAAEIVSQEARDYAYAGVFAIAYCDRELAAPEEKILSLLREKWHIKEKEEKGLVQALEPFKKAQRPPDPLHGIIQDEAAREVEFNTLLLRYAMLAGVTGAVPIPFVSDMLVVPLQVKMVYDIAGLFGRESDTRSVQLMFEALGLGAGARIGISALCKLAPGWGSMVGAASSFATTYALGKASWAYYNSGGKATLESLKPMFRAEQKSGRLEFQKHKVALQEAQKLHSSRLKELAYELQQGRITQKEYEQKIDAL